jgi:hypothetical protein
MTHPTRQGMSAEQVRPGVRVRVMEHHMVHERRDLLVGTVVARYGRGLHGRRRALRRRPV